MKQSIVSAAAGAAVALVLLGASGSLARVMQPTPPGSPQPGGQPTTVLAAPTASGTDTRRTITVTGFGSAKAVPNTATVQVGVQSQAATAHDALADNSMKMQDLVDRVKKSGIDAKDIQTTNFAINAVYDNNNKVRNITGYEVNNTVRVKVRDVTKTSDLLDKVVAAGSNHIFGINFGIDDPSTLQVQARTSAIADARTQAEQMAKDANTTLGQVITISEYSAAPLPMAGPAMGAAAPSAGIAPPIEAGEQQITAQVQMTFELR